MTDRAAATSNSWEAIDHRWAVILAGGDGKRLLPLTRKLSGDDRPKQFCNVIGGETLLAQTIRRVERVISEKQMFAVVTKTHERFYQRHKNEVGGAGLLVQPCNRDTAPAIAVSLVRLQEIDPQAVVGFFPSDHHFADDKAFSDCVCQAFDAAELYSGAVVLLGIAPDRPETEYGWIEPGEPLMAGGSGLVFGVRRFWEKPSPSVAIDLMLRGCFWNSFIMVGRVASFLALIEQAIPFLLQSVRAIPSAFFTKGEDANLRDLYQSIPSSSFSTNVLSARPGNLAVLCSRTLEWADVGDVGRALSIKRHGGIDLPQMEDVGQQERAGFRRQAERRFEDERRGNRVSDRV